MIALTVAGNTYQWNHKRIKKAERLNAFETLLIDEDEARLKIALPQDILFIILNGRREIPKWQEFKGFRVHAWRKDGNVWRILMHPLEDERLVIEAHFRSRDVAIWLPPERPHHEPRRIES